MRNWLGGAAAVGLTAAAVAAIPAASGATTELRTGSSSARADAPPAGVKPSLDGSFRTRVKVTSGGRPFGQHRGDSANRRYRFKERCGGTPCDRVRLLRSGRSGRFGSVLKRRGTASWHGVEKVHGRCSSGLDFHSTTAIDIHATSHRGEAVSGFTGRLVAKVRGCVHGREHASLRGRLR